MKNELYPCGNNFDSFMEYQVSCPICGDIIRYYLPADQMINSYNMSMETCHPFLKSIDRGIGNFYPHKMIKLREDMLGGREYLYDFYHLYPIIKGESTEKRKERLIQIKLSELADQLKDDPDKKWWIVTELVKRNETILHTLESILPIYEETSKEDWNKLDQIIENVNGKDSAIRLMEKFGRKTSYLASHVNPNPAIQVDSISFDDNSFGGMALQGMGMAQGNGMSQVGQKEVKAKDAGQWTCSVCGSKMSGKFCSECGSPRPS